MNLSLGTTFRLSLYTLTVLATWMLGRAEGGWIPFLTMPMLVFAYVLTESKRPRFLPPWLANIAGAVAVAAAAFEFFGENQEGRLLSGAHLLVYATWIVMLQEKNLRNYWWLMALCVLQVAVASVLTTDTWFGMALVVFVGLAIWTMSVASLVQAEERLRSRRMEPLPLNAFPPHSWSRSEVQHDGQPAWITRRFVGGLSLLGIGSLIVSSIFFTVTPRVWIGPQLGMGNESIAADPRRRSVSGFSGGEVRLGDLGTILQSVEPVLEIRFFETPADQPVSMETVLDKLGQDQPLFRGNALSQYRDGRWTPERADRTFPMSRVFRQPGYRQAIRLEPTSSEVLFCVGSPLACELSGERNDNAVLQVLTGTISRELAPDFRKGMNYSVYITPPSPELAAEHATEVRAEAWYTLVRTGYFRRCQDLPENGLERLIELARTVVTGEELARGRELTTLEKCRLLESHLRDTGLYKYTLTLSVKNRDIDPIEDFLFERREGHCEYFASALVLMLRAVGIPARLINGYKGAERHELKGSWQVQQRHAHAWVEAFAAQPDRWITLDPTPSDERAESVEEVSSKLGFWGRLSSTTGALWSDYVLSVSLQKQNDELYGPLGAFLRKTWALAQVSFAWVPNLYTLLTNKNGPSSGTFDFRMLIWMGIVLIAVVAYILKRDLLQRWLRVPWRLVWPERDKQQQIVVAFYERLLRILQQEGQQRAADETPQEFLAAVSQRWQSRLQPAQLAGLPLEISRAFYRIRYGAETLPESEIDGLSTQLNTLEQLLTSRPVTPSTK